MGVGPAVELAAGGSDICAGVFPPVFGFVAACEHATQLTNHP
jgi:hypothetical protein